MWGVAEVGELEVVAGKTARISASCRVVPSHQLFSLCEKLQSSNNKSGGPGGAAVG